MTTWATGNGSKVGRTEIISPNTIAQTYRITVVSGNTGGTLTVPNISVIDNAYATGARVTGPTVLAMTGCRISGKTVVVTHGDPGEAATIYMKVWGKR